MHSDLYKTPPVNSLRISVIVPAKNEEANIWSTLQALYYQIDTQGQPINKQSYEVLVLANNCTDATAATARQFALAHPDMSIHVAEEFLPPEQANIGYVRRLLMDEAYHRLTTLGKHQGIIASTDGDTIVGSTWVYHTIQAIEQGADAVGGRIITPAHQSDYRLYYLQDVMCRHLQAQLESLIDPDPADPWPRHFQNFGPSLAVTCAMYDRAGRLPVVPYLEDVSFYEALRRHDARIRHCPKVQVVTSSRIEGRVTFGFSKQLEEWAAMKRNGRLFQVPCADAWKFRFQLQKQLRTAWQTGLYLNLEQIARQTGAPVHHFYNTMINASYFGGFLQHVMGSEEMKDFLKNRFPAAPISQAIAQLRSIIKYYEKTSFTEKDHPIELPINLAGTALPVDDKYALGDDQTRQTYEMPRALHLPSKDNHRQRESSAPVIDAHRATEHEGFAAGL